MKIVHNHLFSNSLKISWVSVTEGLLLNMLCMIGFDGVLGGLMGTV